MFHKVVVALDRTESSSLVFEEAVSLAKATGAQLMLIHVLPPENVAGQQMSLYTEGYYLSLPQERLELFHREWNEFKNWSLQHLQSDVDTAKAAGVSVDFSQAYGNPGKAICEFAKNWDADLILMGRRGHTGVNELLLGSVSNYVLHHASCAVLTLNPRSPARSHAKAH
ncbi:MAG TPA: universal stress protein [Chroococcidiopsis sp.]